LAIVAAALAALVVAAAASAEDAPPAIDQYVEHIPTSSGSKATRGGKATRPAKATRGAKATQGAKATGGAKATPGATATSGAKATRGAEATRGRTAPAGGQTAASGTRTAASGGRTAAAGGGTARTRKLPARIERRIRARGGRDAKLLEEVAGSPALGAPTRSIRVKKADRERLRRIRSEMPSRALPAAVGAVTGTGDGHLLALVIVMAAMTVLAFVAALLRRRAVRGPARR
jgi:hypothetical protein